MRVDGDLVLSFATVRPPLILWNCHVSACPNFLQTTFPFLTLSGSRLEYGLIGDRMRVDAGLFCRDGFTAKGDVRLLGAQIGGDADFSKATLDNPGSNALSADRIRITGSLFCSNGFVTRGNVILPLAKIDGIFEWKPATWSGRLQMMHARAGQWRDSWNGSRWTCDGEPRIDLRDFSYGTFVAAPPSTDAESRIAWVKASLGDSFSPGPYETLANALRASGDDEGANTVALEKRRHQTRHRLRTDVPPSRRTRFRFALTGLVLDLTTGYGYRPWRGLRWLVHFFVLG